MKLERREKFMCKAKFSRKIDAAGDLNESISSRSLLNFLTPFSVGHSHGRFHNLNWHNCGQREARESRQTHIGDQLKNGNLLSFFRLAFFFLFHLSCCRPQKLVNAHTYRVFCCLNYERIGSCKYPISRVTKSLSYSTFSTHHLKRTN